MVINKRGLVLGATAVVLSTVAVTGAGFRLSQSQAFFQESPKETVDEVWQIINRTYLDGTFNFIQKIDTAYKDSVILKKANGQKVLIFDFEKGKYRY